MTRGTNKVRRGGKRRSKKALLILIPVLILVAAAGWLFLEMRAGTFIDSLQFEKSETTIETGSQEALSILFAPAFVKDKTLSFTSSDPDVASVGENGVVTANAPGSAIISVVHRRSGKSATMVVHVENGGVQPTALHLNQTQVGLIVGQTATLTVTADPAEATLPALLWTSDTPSVATVEDGVITAVGEGSCKVRVDSPSDAALFAEATVTVAKEGSVIEVDPGTVGRPEPVIEQKNGITYVNGIVIINKTYDCPDDYAPGIDPDARAAFYEMQAAAADDGIDIWVLSAYRSYDLQKTLYNNYVARDGKEAADTYSARPGHSEHHSGLCYDVNSLEFDFGETAEGKWLAEHCTEYGFIIRYPKGCEAHTGYQYEPWHIRYLGVELANKVKESGLCLEQYLGITSVYAEDAE